MPQCRYKGPSGRACEHETPDEEKKTCFWHDRQADKSGDDIKPQLEQLVKDRQSLEGFELTRANLEDAWLIEADLSYANLSRVNLRLGHCFGIDLTGATLFKADLERANLREAKLEETDLLGTNLEGTNLDRAVWGPRSMIRNHRDALKLGRAGDPEHAIAKYQEAEDIYRSIRQCYEAAGASDIAGAFFYWEMVIKRKQMPKFSMARFWSKLVDLLCGYGEIPYRAIGSSILYIGFNAIIYSLLGFQGGTGTHALKTSATFSENLHTFILSLYYSTITFTTVGYGDYTGVGWAKLFAALEGFNGAFMIALFIVAFVKKMTR